VIAINTNAPSNQQVVLGMPTSGRVRVSLGMTVLGTAVVGTGVCAYRHVTTAAVRKGDFPGLSAWSPPI